MQDQHGPNGQPQTATGAPLKTSFAEFVVLTALLISLTAMSIDIMLPSLPQIGAAFSVAHANETQQILTSYMVGLGIGQLVWGPLSDRFGRKFLLLLGLLVFVLGSFACLLAPTLGVMLAARAVQGFGGAAARVISVAIVRDLFAGRQMARVMSTVMTVFIAVPIFAPSIGQALAHVGNWRWNFYVLLSAGLIGMLWAGYRLSETSRPASSGRLGFVDGCRAVLHNQVTLGYTIASGFMFACLVSYISSAQQIFVDVYDLGQLFPVMFGAIAGSLAVASFTNARMVQRLGMRRVSHSALFGLLAVALAMSLVSLAVRPPLIVFGPLMALAFFCFGLMFANFNAIAMHPMAHVAGTAASLIGFCSTLTGAFLGWIVGRLFDGTVRPLSFGFLLLGVGALVCVLVVEGSKGLFRGE
jgi:DHA1 family bicyclomycin/chloramphenicol resistance-like MFS transporter